MDMYTVYIYEVEWKSRNLSTAKSRATQNYSFVFVTLLGPWSPSLKALSAIGTLISSFSNYSFETYDLSLEELTTQVKYDCALSAVRQ